MSEGEKVVFPYESFAQAEKDKFKKLGGTEGAFRFLQKGYKSIMWRKKADANAKELAQAEDAAFAQENARPSPPPPQAQAKPSPPPPPAKPAVPKKRAAAQKHP